MLKETICAASMLFGHHSCPDETKIPASAISGDGVIIAYVHAASERGKTHISGAVEKAMNAGSVNSSRVHLDIIAIQKGKEVRRFATTFLPTEIPSTHRGVTGRSTFGVTMDAVPSNSEIRVSVHAQPIALCKKNKA